MKNSAKIIEEEEEDDTMLNNEEELHYSNEVTRTVTISELPSPPFSVTMEIPLFLTMLSFAISGPVLGNILLYRTCVHTLNHTVEECKFFLAPVKSNSTADLEAEVQKYATLVSMTKMVVESVWPAILSFFLGVWSDTYGRKPLIVWPLFGLTLSGICIVVYAIFDEYGPWWLILTSLPFSLTGGFIALFTGSFTYISDVTTIESRSFRMTLIDAAFAAGSFFGSIACSYLILSIGNIYVLMLSAGLFLIAYLYTRLFLKESLNGALHGGLSTVIDFLLVKEMIDTCFKPRPNKGRSQILLLAFSNALAIFIMAGLLDLEYMYTREVLHWAIREYSIFGAVSTLIALISALIGVAFIQKLLRVGDLPFTIFAYLSLIGDFITKIFATKSWHMYLGSSISAFRSLSSPLIRSNLTKILPIEDIAKVFALICAIEAICPCLAPIVYNALYYKTVVVFPAAIYVLSAVLASVCLVMVGFAHCYARVGYQALTNESTC